MRLRIALAAVALAVTTVAHADTITFSLSQPIQTASPGQKVGFIATVFAPATNTGAEFLNGDSFSVGAPGVLDDTSFFTLFPLALTPGQSFTGLLFTVSFPANKPFTVETGSFSLLGGPNGNSSGTLGSVSFQVNATQAPEPSGILLLGTGLLGVVATARRRFTFANGAA